MTYDERTKQRILEKSIPEPNSGCWLWLTYCGTKGYGQIKYKGNQMGAHRVSWIVHRGLIPEGALICHKCDVPCCVNPDHLYVGSNLTNRHDAIRRGRAPQGETAGQSNLTDSDILLIRSDPRPQRAIAKEYGLSHTAIGNIKRGRTWTHIVDSNHQRSAVEWPIPSSCDRCADRVNAARL